MSTSQLWPLDAVSYYVNHVDGRHDVDKTLILRDLQLQSSSENEQYWKSLEGPIHIIDLTNNDLTKLPHIKSLLSVHTLICGRNRIEDLDVSRLPAQLKSLTLSYNEIHSLEELLPLRKAPKSLKNLTLLGNDVCHLDGYRSFVIHLLPQLQVLDFQNVTPTEKKEQIDPKLAYIKNRPKSENKITKKKKDKDIDLMNNIVNKMTDEERLEIKKKLANAESLEEIIRLEQLLSGSG